MKPVAPARISCHDRIKMLTTMPSHIPHFLQGNSAPGTSGRHSPVFNPATGEITSQVALASDEEVNRTVQLARAAFPEWRNTPPLQRARILFRFKAALEAHKDDLARLITAEHGKVLDDARGEVIRGMEVVEYACGIPDLLKGEYTEQISHGMDGWSLRQPLGVCVGITPFNFPVMVPLWMIPMALACGNCFILKPSERDPSPSLLLAELLKQSGLPDGVLSVLHGDRLAVEALIQHEQVNAVSFVGSTPVARHVHALATSTGKRVQALGGAKNHMVIMPDADLDQVVNALLGAAYGSAGERCMAISVAVVVGDVADTLVKTLEQRVANLKVGPGENALMDMGPLITADHRARVLDYIASGVSEGALLQVDGRTLAVPGHEKGFFLGGCLFDHVQPHMRIYREEIFGPVLCVVRVPSFQKALELVNEHDFGNGTALFTRDGGTAREFISQVQAGMVGINVPIPVPMAFHSFGGWKDSLFGDVHIHGPEGVRFYTRYKAVSQRWPTSRQALAAQFAMPTHS